MAAVTYRYMGNSLLTSFKQKFSDADISLTQVVYWIQIVANKYRAAHIKKSNSNAYLVVMNNVPVVSGNTKYVDLSELALHDFDIDGGIEYIAYTYTHSDNNPLNIPFIKISPSAVHRLYLDKYETPTPKNPYYFRDNTKANLLGIENINISEVSMGVYSSIDFFGVTKDLDAKIDFADEYMEMIEIEVSKIMQAGFLIISDGANDGADTTAKNNQGLIKSKQTPIQQPSQANE